MGRGGITQINNQNHTGIISINKRWATITDLKIAFWPEECRSTSGWIIRWLCVKPFIKQTDSTSHWRQTRKRSLEGIGRCASAKRNANIAGLVKQWAGK